MLIRVAVVAAVAALVVPAAYAATPQYDGLKSGYAQLHQILTYHAAAPGEASPGSGFAWRDAGIGLSSACSERASSPSRSRSSGGTAPPSSRRAVQKGRRQSPPGTGAPPSRVS